jgi:hypothetical protein
VAESFEEPCGDGTWGDERECGILEVRWMKSFVVNLREVKGSGKVIWGVSVGREVKGS